VEASQKAVHYEWNAWLGTVLESLEGPLSGIPSTVDNDMVKLEEALQECERLQETITVINDKNAERARRKSLLRRQCVADNLEKEISSIEAQLLDMNSELEAISKEEETLIKTKTLFHETRQLAAEWDDMRSSAEASQKSYLSLKGIHSWTLGKMNESLLEVVTLGTCSQTSSTLSYSGAKNDEVRVNFSSQSTCQNSLYRYNVAVSSFLNVCVKRIATLMECRNIGTASEIGKHMQKQAWLIGRLDLVAKEFHVLQRRYRGKLVRRTNDRFSLLIEFEHHSARLAVDFAVDSAYPSFPLDVKFNLLSGDIDLGALRKILLKNSKTGYGSLSRACDIVQSFVKG
jgi:hypothetical protein